MSSREGSKAAAMGAAPTTAPVRTSGRAQRSVGEAAGEGIRAIRPALASRVQRLGSSAQAVSLVALLVYGLWIVAFFWSGHQARDFADIGYKFVGESHASAVIKDDPRYHHTEPTGIGFDGQFYYYLAVDPANARYYMDWPAYRYGRILYPMTARLLALGRADSVPYTLILINWLALGGGTLVVAAWLKRKRLSPWLALIYGLYGGLFLGLRLDLIEPMACALVALAIYLFDFGGRLRILWAGLAFALAVLTRETVAIFPALYALAALFERGQATTWRDRLLANWRRAALLLGVAIIPLAIYKGVLAVWLGSSGVPVETLPRVIPFQGLLTYWPWPREQIATSVAVVLPALLCASVGLWALAKRMWRVEIVMLLANVQLFVVMLNHDAYSYFHDVERVSAPVVLSALICLPYFARLGKTSRLLFCACAAFWLAPDLYWLVKTW